MRPARSNICTRAYPRIIQRDGYSAYPEFRRLVVALFGSGFIVSHRRRLVANKKDISEFLRGVRSELFNDRFAISSRRNIAIENSMHHSLEKLLQKFCNRNFESYLWTYIKVIPPVLSLIKITISKRYHRSCARIKSWIKPLIPIAIIPLRYKARRLEDIDLPENEDWLWLW